jgi:hypothetical protein
VLGRLSGGGRKAFFVRFDVNARGLPWWATFEGRAGQGEGRRALSELMKSAC